MQNERPDPDFSSDGARGVDLSVAEPGRETRLTGNPSEAFGVKKTVGTVPEN
ncbi:hypothetical protein [Endozoicomonas sp.]|uniref:hypothetical protein n=1 Tax=Endozoicomonas sp. TaxID=1892382 RepID=UPI00383B23B1